MYKFLKQLSTELGNIFKQHEESLQAPFLNEDAIVINWFQRD